MKILGLDPGIARTGFGIIDTSQKDLFVRCGCLTTPAGLPVEQRLAMIGQDLTQLLAAARPDQAVVEQVYFGANSKTAIVTAQTRGVLLYILTQHNIPIESLTPLQIKSRLTGWGRADKHQMQTMVRQRLKLTTLPQPDDAADALAAALCLTSPEQL